MVRVVLSTGPYIEILYACMRECTSGEYISTREYNNSVTRVHVSVSAAHPFRVRVSALDCHHGGPLQPAGGAAHSRILGGTVQLSTWNIMCPVYS